MESILKVLAENSESGLISSLVILVLSFMWIFKKNIPTWVNIFLSVKNKLTIKSLEHHDIFNTCARVEKEVSFMKFYTHGEYDISKSKMCKDFVKYKIKVCSESFNNILKQFEPFGPENMAPLFCTKNALDRGYTKAVGSEKEHLKLHLCSEKERLSEMNGIAFKMGQHASYISKGLPFDICYAIQENVWQGKTSIQLGVKDIKVN